MARYHYYIESFKKVQIYKNYKTTDVEIKNVVTIHENQKDITPRLFTDGHKELVSFILLFIVIVLIFVVFILTTIMEGNSTLAKMAGDTISVLSLLVSFITIPRVKIELNKFLKFGSLENKIVLLVSAIILSFIVALICSRLSYNSKFLNILGFGASIVIIAFLH